MHTIGITGGSASGKTTFVALLKEKCNGLPINFISQDDYYKETTCLTAEEINAINFDHPNAIDFELLVSHIESLDNGFEVQKPLYSFKKHNRLKETELIKPLPILVVEGILILSNYKLKALCNTTIFIDTPENIRKERRVTRDVRERGRTKDSVTSVFEKNISPMHQKYIEPTKHNVDYIFDGTQDFEDPVLQVSRLISTIIS